IAGLLVGSVAGIAAVGVMPPALLGVARGGSFLLVVACSVGAWLWTGIFLYGARRYLVSRAFLQEKKRPKSTLVKVLEVIVLRRRAGGKRRAKGRWPLPGDEPITWREVTRTMIGTPRYFATTAVIAGLAVLALAFLVTPDRGYSRPAYGITVLVTVLWFIAVVSITGMSATSVALERAGQTLELVLTTPLTGSEIVRQKSSLARRKTLFFLVLFLILFVYEAWYEGGMAGVPPRRRDLGPLGYLVTATLAVLVFLPATGWIARWIGLKVRNRTRAMLLAVGAIFVWCAGPWAVYGWMGSLRHLRARPFLRAGVTLLSPATLIGLTEAAGTDDAFRELFRTGPLIPIAVGFALQGGILLFFRWLCLRNADRYLGRAVPGGRPSDIPDLNAAAATSSGEPNA
ncbi:MAG: hypothetical protein ACYTFI_27225, partial [Planctomycetota bacterium]